MSEPVNVIVLCEVSHNGQPLRDGKRIVLGRADGKPLGWVRYLDQGTWWKNAAGEWIEVPSIDARYAGNIIGWLERRAQQLHWLYCLALCDMGGPQGDMASLAWDDELDDVSRADPLPWLQSTALYRAVAARAEAS
ncbi:MAG TPA: hypothetical protein PLV68_05490 [Ilumatobacteraceae bacterium]|nr:hypothetical protein [Ilumatobacteraceae bacterium]